MVGHARALLLAVLMVGVAMAGCVGFGGAEDSCSSQHAYTDRLVFGQAGLYGSLEEAMAAANATNSATWDRQFEGEWTGARGVVETVRVSGRVHGSYLASPARDVSFMVHDSALGGFGPLWLDTLEWQPEGTEKRSMVYEAPATPKADHTFTVRFKDANLSQGPAADDVRLLHDTLFPHEDYDPSADADFSKAWARDYVRHPDGPVRADAALADVIRDGDVWIRQAPFDDLPFPHTLGTVALDIQDHERYRGHLEIQLSHDLNAIAVGTDPTIVLEVTPTDRAYLSNLGSAPLGADELAQEASQRLSGVDGLPELDTDNANYQEGGEVTVETSGSCTPTAALGDKLEAPTAT